MIEIRTVGGYSEVGKNMTAVKYKDSVVILDMGLELDSYINCKDDDGLGLLDEKDLHNAGAIPDDSIISDWKKYVKAIIPSHAHLDHVGAVPYMADKYDCDILASPFTAEVLKAIVKDNKIKLKNKIKVLNTNAVYQVSKDIRIEFINTTHSTPDTVMVAVHTAEGIVLYANDFKLDPKPIIGNKTNIDRLKKLQGKVKVLIMDSLYSKRDEHTKSESHARDLLKVALEDCKNKAVIVTTFSSQIARLHSVIEFGHKMGRKVVFLGRSLAKYTAAAENCELVNFSKKVDIVKYQTKVKRKLREIEKQGRDKYLIAATGHQGEKDAVLSSIASGKFGFRLQPGDRVIFSCSIIPNETNIANREKLETNLKNQKVEIKTDVHVSGHAAGRDHEKLLKILRPENIIPTHGDKDKTEGIISISKRLKIGKVHVSKDRAAISF